MIKKQKSPLSRPLFGHLWRVPDVTQHMLSYVLVKRNYGESLVRGIKLSVEVRNEVYNWFRVFLVLDSFCYFGNLNGQFRACFWPKVKNLTCTIESHWSISFCLETLFSTLFSTLRHWDQDQRTRRRARSFNLILISYRYRIIDPKFELEDRYADQKTKTQLQLIKEREKSLEKFMKKK